MTTARMRFAFALGTMALVCCSGLHRAAAQGGSVDPATSLGGAAEPQLVLTVAQRQAIYAAASKDKSKTARVPFPVKVGASVPPMIELYTLPDDAVAGNSAAKFYEYTMVENQVVVVDQIKMRVIDIIGPQPNR